MAKEIWTTHYSPIIGINQVNYMLDQFQSIEAITNQIDEGYNYFLLKNDENNIGYLSYQIRTPHQLFLSKVYLLANHRGKGYFNQILHFLKHEAFANKANAIQLTVNKNNTNSIQTYLKHGFVIKEEAVFDIGNGYVMDDYVLVNKI